MPYQMMPTKAVVEQRARRIMESNPEIRWAIAVDHAKHELLCKPSGQRIGCNARKADA